MSKYDSQPFLTSSIDCNYCDKNKAFMNLANGKKICSDCWIAEKDKEDTK